MQRSVQPVSAPLSCRYGYPALVAFDPQTLKVSTLRSAFETAPIKSFAALVRLVRPPPLPRHSRVAAIRVPMYIEESHTPCARVPALQRTFSFLEAPGYSGVSHARGRLQKLVPLAENSDRTSAQFCWCA